MRIHLDADRLRRPLEHAGNLLDHPPEWLAGVSHMARIGGQPVDVPQIQGMADLVGLGAVEE